MNFFGRLDRVDRLIQNGPEKADFGELRALVSEIASERYLFSKVTSAEWLLPLYRAGWFQAPPDLQKDKSGSYYVQWPALSYVSNVVAESAQQQHFADLIVRILTNMPRKDNPQIFKQIIEIALRLPTDKLDELVFTLQDWLDAQKRLSSKDLSHVIARLAKAGFTESALRLFRAMFALFLDAEYFSSLPEKRLLPDPKARLSEWEYATQLEFLTKELQPHSDIRLVIILAELLNDAVRFSQSDAFRVGPQDISYVWRPAIEEHSQNRGRGLQGALVAAIRDCCDALLQRTPERFPEVLQILSAHQWFIFTRLILHLLRVSDAAPSSVAGDYLTQWSLFDEVTTRHEYALLLKGRFKGLLPEQQEKILAFITEGPDRAAYIAQHRMFGKGEATPEQVERFVRSWQHEWLGFIRDDLSEKAKAQFAQASEESQVNQHPEFPTYIESSSQAFVSPIEIAELESKTIQEIAAYVRNWHPTAEVSFHSEPSRSGLSGTLTTFVARNASAVAQSADLFRDLDATYLHAIVIGFSEALRRGSHLDWREVLEFCRGILTQPDFKRPYMPPEYEDPDWMWTRRDIGSLLQIGLEQEQAQIPIKLREAVWPLIEILAQDQQPSEKDEERKENNFDPVLSALNTVRGIGVQLAIRYALWVRKATDNFTMKSAPEVSALLKSKLLISKEPTLTVRSVFGQWFPWLMLLDPEWTQSIVDDIFPDSHKLARYWQAAWGSYVGYCSAYDVVYPALSRKYERAVAEINAKWSIEMAHTDPQKRLAEHLVAYYWRGLLPQKLLQQFFHKASEPIQEHGLEVIGRSLDAPSAPSGQVLDRLRDLYEWLLRRKKMRPSPQPQFAAFGYWFASGIFESNWSLRALRTSLQMAGDIEAAEKVLERMKGLVKENSGLVLECLAILVSQDQELWQIDSWQEHIHQILSSVEEPISEDSKKWMSEIANRMGEMGYLQFRRFAA